MEPELQMQSIFLPDTHAKKCGCYLRRPHVLRLEYPRAMVPLKHIDYQLEVVNSLVNITLKQKYQNPTDQYLEVDYSFPISPDASIYKFSAEFNNVTIQGIVKEKQEAKKEYEQAKSEGKQAVLGTLDPLSKDIMNLEIGNIPPHTDFTINISFMQEMSISLNTFYKIQIPSTISPRYTDSIYHAIEKARKENKKAIGKAEFTWSFKIDVKTTKKVSFFNSPSHEITLISQNEERTETLLVMAEASLPNKDFTFLYTTEQFHLPSYVVGKTDVSSTAMLSFIPKFCTMNINDAYKAEVEHRTFEPDMETAKGDYVFLLDRSGSMGGSRIDKAKEALILFLKSLPEDSYFNVISFGSSQQKMFNKSKKYAKDTLDKAITSIRPMGANLGGTVIYEPLREILEEKVNKGYPKHVFLLTDGGVSNTEGVLKLIKAKTNYCRVHSIGIGNGASFNLIQGSAKNGKGKYIMISDNESPAQKIIQLLESTLTPLITNIELKYDKNIVESIVPNPNALPYILKDDVINFYVNFKGPLNEEASFIFEYQDSITKVPYKAEIQVNPDTFNQPFVNKMAHLKVVKALEEAAQGGISIEDRMMYVKVKDYKQEAIKESVKHQVLSEYTAFLCIGKELVDGQYQEFVDKGTQKVHIQQPKPVEFQEQMMLCSSNAMMKKSRSRKPAVKGMAPSKPLERMAQKKSSGSGFFAAIGEAFTNLVSSSNQRSKPSIACMGLMQSPSQRQQRQFMSQIRQMPQRLQMPQMRQMRQKPLRSYMPKMSSQMSQKPVTMTMMHNRQDEMMRPQRMKQKNVPKMFLKESLPVQTLSRKKDSSFEMQQDEFDYSIQDEIGNVFSQSSKKKDKETLVNPKIIEKLVNSQNIDGSWSEKSLIKDILGDKSIEQLAKTIKKQILITYLAILFIQKNHPQKQYALLVKKAQSWLKKACDENKIDESKLKVLDQLI